MITFESQINRDLYETEEKKAQVCSDIWNLLVCVPGPVGRRDSEIPDTPRLFRVIRLGGDFADYVGRTTYIGGIYLYKRIINRSLMNKPKLLRILLLFP